MNFKVSWIAQPIAIAIFPVLHTINSSMYEVGILDCFFAIIISTTLTTILFFTTSLIYQSYKKGALITNICIISFYSTKFLIDFALIPISKKFYFFRVRYALILLFLFLVFCFYKLVKINFKSTFLLHALLIPFMFLDIFALTNYIKNKFLMYKSKQSFSVYNQEDTNHSVGITPDTIKTSPDIYFIILDAYTSSSALKTNFEFDNSEFLNNLRQKGFVTSPNATSHYKSTLPSICSTLNLNHVPNTPSPFPTIHAINNSHAKLFLEKLGYTYFDLSQYYDDISIFNYQNYQQLKQKRNSVWGKFKNFLFGNQYFTNEFLKLMTPIHPLVLNFFDTIRRNSIVAKLKMLKKISKIPKKKFVYAHFLIPHFPFSFDENGNKLKSQPKNITDEEWQKFGYTQAIKFINKKISSTIDIILENSTSPPIIILQGDHGSGYGKEEKDCYKILNAFHLPNKPDIIPDNACSINNFRFIFNHYFGTKFQIL